MTRIMNWNTYSAHQHKFKYLEIIWREKSILITLKQMTKREFYRLTHKFTEEQRSCWICAMIRNLVTCANAYHRFYNFFQITLLRLFHLKRLCWNFRVQISDGAEMYFLFLLIWSNHIWKIFLNLWPSLVEL